jgi:glycosyltransferase involved in cell wall biosynthesis
MKRFLPDNRLLWVNTIGMRKPRINLSDIKRSIGKIRSWLTPRENKRSETNLTIISPIMIPYATIPLVRGWNRLSVIRAVRSEMRRLSFNHPIVLTTLPNASDYLNAFDEILDVYYCVDEFSEWPGVEKELVSEMEATLLEKTDFVVAVSDELLKSKSSPYRNTFLLTHGVDVNHFQSGPELSGTDQLMPGMNKPIIGFFGLIDERTDRDLLQLIVETRSQWSLAVIGKSVVDLTVLNKYNNFLHINEVKYEDLPKYSSYFDACILPYKINKLTDNINPLKLKEYLATGKPVISTALPEAVKLQPLVNIGTSHREIIEHLDRVLACPHDCSAQIQYLQSESWDSKADIFAKWIEEAINKKETDYDLQQAI